MMRRFFLSTIEEVEPPPVPPSYNVLATNVTGTGSGFVATRQLAFEPSVAGVDRPMSWSIWMRCVNIGVGGQYAFTVADPATGTRQYGLFVRSQTESGAINQHLQFILQNGANFIRIVTSQRLLKGRWNHVVVTYNGGESQNGFEIYLNKVLDSTATKDFSGVYVGAANNAAFRLNLSNVFSGSRFRGNLRDLAIWDKVLNQSEVDELYNNDVPVDVTTVSFYGANIEGLWPLHTDAVCAQGAAFNFGTLVGITFGSRPLSSAYPSFSIQNARVGNTRYLAFGTALKDGVGAAGWIGDATSHVVDTVIDKYFVNPANILAPGGPVTWVDDVLNALPDGLRGANVGIIDGKIFNLTSQYDDVVLAFKDFGKYESTDGLTGEAFSSFTSLASPAVGQSINGYGNIIEGDAPGEHYIAYHEYTVALQTICVWKTTDYGVTWTKIPLFTGNNTKGYNEPYIIRVAPQTYIMLVREQAGACISCAVTTDAFATMSVPVNSTLATGTGMASMCFDDDGNIVVFYADRGDGFGKISLGNVVADILANPSDWNAGSSVFQTIDGTANLLGYTFIINLGGEIFCGGISSEQNPPGATRADFFVGIGAFGAG